jgi:hypothetical protein
MKRLLFFFFALYATLMPVNPLQAQQVQSSSYRLLLQQRGEIYFRFLFTGKAQLQKLNRFLSVDKISGDTAYAYAHAAGFAHFLKEHIAWTLLTPPSQRLSREKLSPPPFKSSNTWDYYPSYQQYLSLMQDFQKLHPDLCQIVSIGTSAEGRKLLFAHIGHQDSKQDSLPQFMYTSTMHGDETTGYILMLHLIDYMLTNYGKIPAVTALIDSVDIWINPLANPDGTYASGDSSVYGSTRFNAHHIDLNRNYPDPRAGDHPDGNDWQPETVAFMHFAKTHHFVLSCNLHTGSEVANYPWDTWFQRTADDAWWRKVCRQYADTVHAHAPAGFFTDLNDGITDGYDWYSITGGRQDYMNYFQYDREFTLELSSTKLPAPGSLPSYWEYHYRSLLQYMHQVLRGLRGTVTDSLSGKPVKAEIFVLQHDTMHSQVYSDSLTGMYFRPLLSGTYDLRFSAPGYYDKTIKNVQIGSGKPTVLSVRLSGENASGILSHNMAGYKIYPNPAENEISSSAFSLNSQALVMSLSGKVLLSQPVGKGESVDISNLPRGGYLLKVISGDRIIYQKFIKQ